MTSWLFPPVASALNARIRTGPSSVEAGSASSQDIFNNSPMHIGHAKIASLKFVCEPFVIDSQLMQERCLEIVDVHRVLDHIHRQLIGLAV